MPNHIHCILNFPDKGFSLNKIISNAKRFMAYEILKRLSIKGEHELLLKLKNGLTQSRLDKGQQHCAFRESFDAKAITSGKFLNQKLRYMHLNPVRGNYNLIEDWRDYPHSSAGFYEYGQPGYFAPVHFLELA
jgi:REP element-mobilizing transposase RayT